MGIRALAALLPTPLRAFLQRVISDFYYVLPLELRYGSAYREASKFLRESEWWSAERLKRYQLKRLRELVEHANEHVPYYRALFREHGIVPAALNRLEDIRQIPYLTKENIQNNLDDLVSVKHKSRLQYVTTGGSTGTPTGFYWEDGVTEPKENAFVWFLWSWCGVTHRDRFVILRGASLPEGQLLRRVSVNTLLASSYHLTEAYIPRILQGIEAFAPTVFHVYPSALNLLARWMDQNAYTPNFKLKGILTSSENLYPFQEALFSRVFQAKIHDLYGNSEKTTIACRCEANRLHFAPQYGVTELVRPDGEWCSSEGERGEIISTGFINDAMPLIRYRTDDIGVYGAQSCSCGRAFPVLARIEGRKQELIVTRTGRRISMTAINMHSDVFDNVRQLQFQQEKEGEVILKVVRRESYGQKDSEYIVSEVRKKLGDDVDLTLKFVDSIPLTGSGKHRWLIQKLPVRFSD